MELALSWLKTVVRSLYDPSGASTDTTNPLVVPTIQNTVSPVRFHTPNASPPNPPDKDDDDDEDSDSEEDNDDANISARADKKTCPSNGPIPRHARCVQSK